MLLVFYEGLADTILDEKVAEPQDAPALMPVISTRLAHFLTYRNEENENECSAPVLRLYILSEPKISTSHEIELVSFFWSLWHRSYLDAKPF